MTFSSASFLFLFLPLTAAAYFVCGNRVYRNAVLIAASMLFYLWGGGVKMLLLFLGVTVLGYGAGLLLDLDRLASASALRKAVYIIMLILLLSPLFLFKYLKFTADNLSALFGIHGELGQLVLPLGISFYTFQIISYTVDVYRKTVKPEKNPFRMLLYMSFFPQLVMGPIVRYGEIRDQLSERRTSIEDISRGMKRFVVGLAKKIILANNAAAVAEMIYTGDPAVYGTAMYWVAALSYTLEIYFDFSGYSDMAVGLGRVFGFRLPENFDHPYTSLSATEFWRRWHITLSGWFRDYVYIPMGGNRVSRPRWLINIMTVWLLTGLWHGAAWNFVLWGLYYGLMLVLEKLVLGRLLKKLPEPLAWLWTFAVVNVGWVIFNLTDPAMLTAALKTMFIFRATPWLDMFAANITITRALVYLPLGLICSQPLLRYVKPAETPAGELLQSGCTAVLLILCILFLLSSTYNPFIYFQF